MTADLLRRAILFATSGARANWTLSEAEQYTRWLATHHYENFHVVSFLLPKELHQDFYNVYSYCRWADDLARRNRRCRTKVCGCSNWWRGELDRMYAGEAQHPVFVALRGHGEEIRDSEAAFRRSDPRVHPGSDRDALSERGTECSITACIRRTRSAGWCSIFAVIPMRERQRLSDATCTALQLANFWQDVTVDQQKDRVYLPLDLLAKHNYTVEELFAHGSTIAFARIMHEAVDRARELFLTGLPLTRMVNRRLAVDLELFSRGGHAHSGQDRAAGLRRAVAAAEDLEGRARGSADRHAGARGICAGPLD